MSQLPNSVRLRVEGSLIFLLSGKEDPFNADGDRILAFGEEILFGDGIPGNRLFGGWLLQRPRSKIPTIVVIIWDRRRHMPVSREFKLGEGEWMITPRAKRKVDPSYRLQDLKGGYEDGLTVHENCL